MSCIVRLSLWLMVLTSGFKYWNPHPCILKTSGFCFYDVIFRNAPFIIKPNSFQIRERRRRPSGANKKPFFWKQTKYIIYDFLLVSTTVEYFIDACTPVNIIYRRTILLYTIQGCLSPLNLAHGARGCYYY